jgi:hypothetical protein
MRAMTAWSSPSLVACLLLFSACPADLPEPPPADESSSGPGSTSTGMGPATTPEPLTSSTSSGADTTASDTSDPGTTTTTTGGQTDSTSSTGDDTSSTGDPSSSGDPTTTGDPTTGDPTTGDPTTGDPTTGDPTTSGSTTTGGDPCAAGDGPDFIVGNNGAADYVIDGVNDPGITVVRGCSYTFTVAAAGHPFFIKTMATTGVGNQYNDGVINNGTQNGIITWDVPLGAPDALFYICQFHASMTGTITVID